MKTPRRPPARRRGRKNQPATVLVFVLLAAILTLWQSIKDDDAPADHAAAPGVTQPILGEPGSALATVDELTVKGRAARTGYARDNFGAGWKDPAGIGCDQRNIILARDLTDVTYRSGSDCIIESGILQDPFSGKTIPFERGPDTSPMVQIDHLVALSDAWQKGAQDWDDNKRILFANDPLNLLAVDGPLNQQKGDADVATWLPPRKEFRCEYVARIIAVKHHYELWVTAPERDAMRDVLRTCPSQPLPGGGYELVEM